MSNFKVGLIVDSLRMGIMEGIRTAASLGVEGIQIHSTGEMDPDTISDSKIKDVLALVHDSGLTISAVTGNLGGHALERAEESEQKISLAKRKLDFAKRLGCDIVATHIGVIPSDESHPRYAIMHSALSELGAYAQAMGSCLAIETGPERTEVLAKFIDGLPCGGVAVNYDPANLLMVTGEDPVSGVYNLRGHIVHTHAKDGVMLKQTDPEVIYNYFASGGIEDVNLAEFFREEALGEGDVDFDAYLDALTDIGFSGFLTIERELGSNPVKDVKLAVDFLKDKLTRR